MDNNEKNDLLTDLLCCSSLGEYVARNQKYLYSPDLKAHLERLLEEKHAIRNDVIKNAQIERVYGFQIFTGKKTPSRDKLIQLGFGFKLGVHQIQKLLEIGGVAPLRPYIMREAILLFSLSRGYDVLKAESLLSEWNEPSLLKL